MAGRENPQGPTAQTVRANIAEFREAAELTYAEMSRRLDEAGRPIPPLGLRRIEAGERRVDVDDLTAIAVVLDVSPMRLLLPGVQSAAIDGEATGTGIHSTHDLWVWALGYKRLGVPLVGSRDYARRSAPRHILSRRERAERRATWLSDQLDHVRQKISEISAVGKDDQFAAEGLLRRYHDEIDALNAMDPSNDDDFAFLGDDDPAPPSPEELAGLLTEGDDDGTPAT